MWCCPECRLLQEREQDCRQCGHQSLELVVATNDALFVPMSSPIYRNYDWLLVAPVVLTGIWMFVASTNASAALMFLSIIPLFFLPRIQRRRRKRMISTGGKLALRSPAKDSLIIQGRASALSQPVASFSDDSPCLACYIVATRGGHLVARAMRECELTVRDGDGEPVVVAGEIELDMVGRVVPSAASCVEALGIPETVGVDRVVEVVVREGMHIRVFGATVRESRPELAASHGEGGGVLVARGRTGAPVIIRRID
jgi:hypothetical protein